MAIHQTPMKVLNAAEAEIVSLSSAAQECLFLRKLCIEMGFHQHRPTIITKTAKPPSPFQRNPLQEAFQTHRTPLVLHR